jgi:hypothetical protein
MKVPKPTEADRSYFNSLVPDDPRVATKPMFGNLAAFGPEGRPMMEYVALPDLWRKAPERGEPWIARALDYVGSLPPKKAG